MFNAYCEQCHETISFWPEFVLPYQREPLETHEQVVVEHLQGISLKESAARIGYDPHTLSRWITITSSQALDLFNDVIKRLLSHLGQGILPLSATVAREATKLLLAWLHNFAERIGFPRHKPWLSPSSLTCSMMVYRKFEATETSK